MYIFNQRNPTSYSHCNHNEKGMILTRIRGGCQTLNEWEKSMCHHPVWFSHFSLSYPTTTLNVQLSSWGSYCFGSGGGKIVSPCPTRTLHSNETSCWVKEANLGGFPLSPLWCWTTHALPNFHSLHCMFNLTHRQELLILTQRKHLFYHTGDFFFCLVSYS